MESLNKNLNTEILSKFKSLEHVKLLSDEKIHCDINTIDGIQITLNFDIVDSASILNGKEMVKKFLNKINWVGIVSFINTPINETHSYFSINLLADQTLDEIYWSI